MRHGVGYRKLNRTSSHRQSMLANMAASLIKHEQIRTTLPKAKELRPFVERLVTMGRQDSLHSRRMVISKLKDKGMASKLFDVLGPRYQDRPGGYTRIMRAGYRKGDSAPMAIIEFVERDESAKGLDSGPSAEVDLDAGDE